MKFCQNCGKKLLDDARFCESCGTPVITDAKENVDDAQTFNEENVNDCTLVPETIPEYQEQIKMKKKFVFTKKTMSISAVVLAVLVVVGIVIGNVVSSNKYKEKLLSTYESIIFGAEKAESYASLESKVWRNCIYEESSNETDKYTKNEYGSFYSDFNDALSNFYEGESLTYSSVSINVSVVDNDMSELKDCPKKFEDEYRALKELYIAYSNLTDLVVGTSSYSWNTFNETLESAKSDYKTALSSARLLLE